MEPSLLPVPDDAVGTRLDVWLATLPEVDSRAVAERLIAAGHVLVADARRPKSYRLEAGDTVSVVVPGRPALVAEPVAFAVRYEDEHLVVVDKPAGVVTHPAGSRVSGTLVNGLLALGAAGGRRRARGSSTASTVTPRGCSSSHARRTRT